MERTNKTNLILWIAVLSFLALTACGDISIGENADIDIGGGKTSHRNNLYAGPCGLWDITGEYEGVTFSGRCQLEIDAGTQVVDNDLNWYLEPGKTVASEALMNLETSLVMTVDYPAIVDDDFELGQTVLFKVVGLGPFGADYESCEVQLNDDTLYIDCGSFYLETPIKK